MSKGTNPMGTIDSYGTDEKLGDEHMVKKVFILIIFALLLFTACTYNSVDGVAYDEFRAEFITSVTQSSGDQIVLVSDVEVSRTGIAFSLENTTDLDFKYGEPWDLAFYLNGRWMPVPYLTGVCGGIWASIGFTLQSGGIQQYRQDWSWRFGELPPGRYMFIRDGWLGDWQPNQDIIYALVEFYITEDSPTYLPPQSNEELPSMINLMEYSNITPNGMSIVIENVSAYDIDHRAQIIAIVHERYVVSDNSWEWEQYGLPLLPVEGCWLDYLTQGIEFLPSGGQLEFSLDWTIIFGELSPGEYRIILDVGGRAHPPHPTGRAFNQAPIVISFTI